MPSYGAYQGSIALLPGDYVLESAGDNITANATGGQVAGTPIVTQTSRITTAANSSAPFSSICLPLSVPGLEILVINHGANPIQVFGSTSQVTAATDVIDDQAAGTGVTQMSNSLVIYTAATAGKWYSEGLATGFSTSLGLQTVSNSTIAGNVAGTQAAGTPVTTMLTNVTTAGASYSITLPVSVPGLELAVHNISANTLLVFPNAGGTTTEKINALASNASLSMLTNTSTLFTCQVAGQWYTVPRVPS